MLTFLRCGVTVDNEQVVAVALSDVETSLSLPVNHIRRVLEGKWGKMVQKDFLREGARDTVIRRRVNDRKRRCFTFYTKFIPMDIMKDLQQGIRSKILFCKFRDLHFPTATSHATKKSKEALPIEASQVLQTSPPNIQTVSELLVASSTCMHNTVLCIYCPRTKRL